MKNYRAVVIGLGAVGFEFDLDPRRKVIWTHSGAYLAHPSYTLVGVCDISQERRRKFTQRYSDVFVFSSVAQLCEEICFDVVSICTPPQTHFPVIEEILKMSRPRVIVCEKPLADNVIAAREIVRLCEEAKVLLVVNHNRRWDYRYRKAYGQIKEGKIGKINSLFVTYNTRLWTMGTHMIDVMRMFGGEISLALGWGDRGSEKEPSYHALVKFKEGARGILLNTEKRNSFDISMEVRGTRGMIRMMNNGKDWELFQFQSSERASGYDELILKKRQSLDEQSTFLALLDNILKVMEGKGEILCTGRDGLRAVEIVSDIIETGESQTLGV